MAQNVLSEKRVMMLHMDSNSKAAKSFPEDVRDAIVRMGNRYPTIRSFMFKAVDSDYKFYAGEGRSYEMIVGNDIRSVEMVAEHNLGASGVSHAINAPIEVPVGGFLIEVTYYGNFWMTVYNIQPKAVPPESPETAKEILGASIGLDMKNVDPEKGVVTCKCGSLVPTMKNGDCVCVICGRGQNISKFVDVVLAEEWKYTIFCDVEYEPYKPQTYTGLQLRVKYYGQDKSIILYRSPKNSETNRQKQFEQDWMKLSQFASDIGIAGQPIMCTSSVHDYMSDAHINGHFMGMR